MKTLKAQTALFITVIGVPAATMAALWFVGFPLIQQTSIELYPAMLSIWFFSMLVIFGIIAAGFMSLFVLDKLFLALGWYMVDKGDR